METRCPKRWNQDRQSGVQTTRTLWRKPLRRLLKRWKPAYSREWKNITSKPCVLRLGIPTIPHKGVAPRNRAFGRCALGRNTDKNSAFGLEIFFRSVLFMNLERLAWRRRLQLWHRRARIGFGHQDLRIHREVAVHKITGILGHHLIQGLIRRPCAAPTQPY